MSETTDPHGGAPAVRTHDYATAAAITPGGSGLLRLGGALGIAACCVGLAVLVSGCLGVSKAMVLSIIRKSSTSLIPDYYFYDLNGKLNYDLSARDKLSLSGYLGQDVLAIAPTRSEQIPIDVGVRWSCRTGVCHSCESGVVEGAVDYAPQPLEEPGQGVVLVCCARPTTPVILDL